MNRARVSFTKRQLYEILPVTSFLRNVSLIRRIHCSMLFLHVQRMFVTTIKDASMRIDVLLKDNRERQAGGRKGHDADERSVSI